MTDEMMSDIIANYKNGGSAKELAQYYRGCIASAGCILFFFKQYSMLHVGHSGSMRKHHESALSCLRHAADTAPLEGSLVLRCAIYDPLERLQISKMRLSEMGVWDLIFWCVAHAVVSSSGGAY